MPSEYAVFARDGAAIRVIFAARWPESCASIAVRKPRPGLRRDGNYHLPFAATAARTSASSCSGEELGSRSEEHTSELQSLMRNSYAVFCLKKNKKKTN